MSQKMNPIVKIVRLEQSEQGALGALLLYGHYFCSTLEPDSKDPNRFQIPEGIYLTKRYHSVKYPSTFEIIVSGHTAILYHSGNIEDHTDACILLGQYPGKLRDRRAVLNSGVTFEKFMAILSGVPEFYTQIKDGY